MMNPYYKQKIRNPYSILQAGINVFLLFGSAWAPIVLEVLAGSEIGAWLELLVPFLPMLFIGIGAVLYVSRN